MFRIDWIDKYFSRVKPWQVAALWIPFGLYLLSVGLRNPALSLPAWAGYTLGGLFGWTLLEYLLHRWVFHFKPNPDSEMQRDLSFLIHGVHHDYPHDADRLVMPPFATAVIVAILWQPLLWVIGPAGHAPFFGALVLGYVWYDLTHFATHHGKALTALGRWQKKNHMRHHFKPERVRFGVTTPIWDYVFRTHDRLDDAHVPTIEDAVSH